MEIVPLPTNNLQDIPQLMEAVAGEIRSGDLSAQAAACVVLGKDGGISVFGWGQTDDVHCAGILHLGMAWLAAQKISADG